MLLTNSVEPESEGSSPCSQEPATGPYPEPNESTSPPPPQPIILKSNLIPTSHLCPELSHRNPVHSLLFHMCHMPCPLHSPDLICLLIFGEEYKLWTYTLCNFLHSPVISSLLGPNILLRTLFSNTLSLYSSPNVRDQVSHPHKTTGRIMVLYVLNFTFLESRREDKKKRLWTEW
jgi:hypothetical protein